METERARSRTNAGWTERSAERGEHGLLKFVLPSSRPDMQYATSGT
jgi:hypothetical protein